MSPSYRGTSPTAYSSHPIYSSQRPISQSNTALTSTFPHILTPLQLIHSAAAAAAAADRKTYKKPMIHTGRRVLSLGEDPRDQPPRASLPVPNDPGAAAIRFDPPSMAVTALVLLVFLFFIAFFSFFARRLFPDVNGSDLSHHRPPPLQLSQYRAGGSAFSPSYPASGLDNPAIRALPVLSYNASGGGKAAPEAAGCVVCLSEFEEKESVKVIPACGHVFHPECIDAWLASRGSCPICRCSEMFGSGFRGGEVSVDVFFSGGGGGGEEEFVLEVVGEREEEEEVGGGEGKVVALGRSRSWCGRVGGERTVFLRRTCSV